MLRISVGDVGKSTNARPRESTLLVQLAGALDAGDRALSRVEPELEVGKEDELNRAAHTLLSRLEFVVRVLALRVLVFGAGLELQPPQIEDGNGTSGVRGIAAEASRHAQKLDAKNRQRIVVERQVAGSSTRAELVVRQSIELGIEGVPLPERTRALERVLVEPHSQVKDLPALE